MPTSATRVSFPVNSWYAAASSSEVGRSPLGVRVLDRPVVLYRDSKGDAVALEDRCCHSSYPLSLGRVEADSLRCGYNGFLYGPDGRVTDVPTQAQLPVGASVDGYPTIERGGWVWVWLGVPGRAALRELPELPWLTDAGWTTFGDDWLTEADASLLQDNFADITHVAYLDPAVAPPVLSAAPPPLQVTVSERTVSFSRDYPAASLQTWQAEILGVPLDSAHVQREEGHFLAPGLWVDRWDITVAGHGASDGVHTLYFTHALTPVASGVTAHSWRVSRNFAPVAAATGTMQPLMTAYYRRVQAALEEIQAVMDADGPGRGINVAADTAKLAVRKIMRRIASTDGVRG